MQNLIAELLHEREYNLKPLTYSVHNRGVLLAELVEDPLVKYADKDRYNETGLMNLWMGSRGQLMEPWEVQQDSHTLGT